MVRIATFISAVALFSTLASGAPSLKRRQDDSAIGDQVEVNAPDGIPITNAGELASQRSREAAQTQTSSSSAPVITQTGSYGSAKYGASPAAKIEAQHTETSSTAAHATTTSSSAAHTSSSVAHTSSSVAHTTSTSAHTTAAPLPTHGSGSANWGNEAYNDCVQQCIATHGAPGAQYQPSATVSSSAGSTGTGATHTVIVAPTQGVLRYIPFAVNATVGDTIKFMWGANNHTVTKGSALLPCNRSSDAVFASGTQNNGFVFTQVVNETTPTYFFCGTATHCQKGMFGVVNPTTNFQAVTSVSGQLATIAANNSAVAGYAAYAAKLTEGNPAAARWGGGMSLDAYPDWAQASVVENVLFTRAFLAKNPETLKEDGSIDLSTATSTPLVIPEDISAALASSGTATETPAVSSATPAATTTPDAGAGNAANLGTDNGALSSASPRLLVAVMAILATFMLL